MANYNEAEFVAYLPEDRAKNLIEHWDKVESSLQKLDIACHFIEGQFSSKGKLITTMRAFPTNKASEDSIARAKKLVELLFLTCLPVPVAVQVAIHDRPCKVIKLGYSNGGLRARFKIDKEKFDKRKKRFKNHMKKIADLTETNLYLSGCNLAVTGRSALGSSVGLLMVKRIAFALFVENMMPENVVQRIEKNKKALLDAGKL
ncbi:uncharacterized protein LOC133722509 [Rosa rugosa]|uniref:uncharacterized protein LOC133722509 n=1 Tax=Rosa rugosa TaxID=74645 RepID=UPI002B412F05|nr:uncharacterized protein LOC133722509 [Rosa rugosa]